MLQIKEILTDFKESILKLSELKPNNKKISDTLPTNKIIIFFNANIINSIDNVQICNNFFYSIYICLYKDVNIGCELKEDIFVPFNWDINKDFSSQKEFNMYVKDLQNINYLHLQPNIMTFNTPLDDITINKNVYIQKKVKELIQNLNFFFNNNNQYINIYTIDFISLFGDKFKKFKFWNEITTLSNTIKYFEKDGTYKLIILKTELTTIRFYDMYHLIPIKSNQLNEYLLQINNFENWPGLTQIDFEFIYKNLYYILFKENINIEDELIKQIYIYIYIYYIWYTGIKLKAFGSFIDLNLNPNNEFKPILDHININNDLQFNITKHASLTSLGKKLFNIKEKYKVYNDETSITLGKQALISGIIDLEYTNQEHWENIKNKILNNEISSWKELKNYATQINVCDIYEYDINGAFSFGGTKSLVIGKGEFKEQVDLNKDKGLALIYAKLNNNNFYIPIKPYLSNKVYLSNTDVYGWYFIHELKQLQELGCEFTIKEGYVYKKNTSFLKNDIELLTWLKNIFNNSLLIKQIKLLSNGLYGFFAFKEKFATISFNSKLHTKYNNKDDIINYTTYPCYDSTGTSVTKLNILHTDKKEYPYSVITYANITANNRINFRQHIWELKKKNPNIKFYQMNIDSIFTNLDLNLNSNKLGEFKFVKKNKIIFFAPQFFLNITEEVFFINNKKIVNFEEMKDTIKQFLETNKFEIYYKVYNKIEHKFEFPNTNFLNNLKSDLKKIQKLEKKIKSVYNESENLSIIIKDTKSVFTDIIQTMEREKKTEKNFYIIEFFTVQKDDPAITAQITINVPENIFTNFNNRQAFLLKCNAILTNWLGKYDNDNFDNYIYLIIYNNNKTLKERVLLNKYF